MNPHEGYVFDRLATHAVKHIAELIGGGALTEGEAETVTNWVDSAKRYLVLAPRWAVASDHLEEIRCEVASAMFSEHIDGTPEFQWHLYADADHPIVTMLLR